MGSGLRGRRGSDMANHGSFHVSVPQEFLDGADIVAAFEQLRCAGMSERVACRVFWNPGLSGRLFHGLLDGFVEMMPTFNIGVIEVRLDTGKTHCQPHSRDAWGYFRSSASGNQTRPAMYARSWKLVTRDGSSQSILKVEYTTHLDTCLRATVKPPPSSHSRS